MYGNFIKSELRISVTLFYAVIKHIMQRSEIQEWGLPGSE